MSKDDATWLTVAYGVFGLIMGYIGYQAIEMVGIQTSWVEKYDSWFAIAQNLGAVAVGAGCMFWAKSDKERREYHLASIAELRKVTWPSFPDTKRMTMVVVVVVLIVSAILAVFDFLWSSALKAILA